MSKENRNTVTIITAIVGSIATLFLLWKFVVVLLVAIMVDHTIETAMCFFLIMLSLGTLIWYLGYKYPKNLREENDELYLVLDENGIHPYTDIYGETYWGDDNQIAKWKKEDQQEKDLNSYCDALVNRIREFQIDKRFEREDPYKQQLRGHLAKEYPRSKVEVQTNDSRPDIVIGNNRIAIEVKGPTTTSALTTLYEKAEKYDQHYLRLIFVLFEPEYNESRYKAIKTELEDEYGDFIRFVTMKRVVAEANN